MHGRRFAAAAATVIGLAAMVASPPAARADDSSPTSWRPGPPILYEEPATAPQLTNSGPFEARPLLVSGAHAYVDGEFLYQDFLYDDTGANGRIPDPNDKRPQSDLFSSRTGTYSYPSDSSPSDPASSQHPTYAGNAADLVELRVKPLDDSTTFRITLTELMHPELVAATIGIGTVNSQPNDFPYGANVKGLADTFVTIHGTVNGGMTATDGTHTLPVSVDTKRAQITVRIPPALYPHTDVWRLTAGVGLWNAATSSYVLPSQMSSATTPGGAGALTKPAAFFNVAFRESETAASTFRFTAPQQSPTQCMWRDCLQAAALANNDISSLHEDVDFGKLKSEVTDRSGVPTTGSIDRIMSSHTDYGDDVTYAKSNSMVTPPYYGEYQGRLQPYNLYVSPRHTDDDRYPLTLLLHSLSANYNQYMDTNNQAEFGDRNRGLVATSEARGPDGWYYDIAEADVFEMWADIAHHYGIDPTRTALTGYSMGGYATYKLGTQFPDLFSRAFATVGPPADGIWTGPPGVAPATGGDQTNTYFMLDSLRNLPILIWHGTNDELVPADGPQLVAKRLDDLGYRYEIDTFPGYDHFAFAEADNYTYPTAFLDDSTVVLNPAHITYVVNPTMDFPGVGVVADKAYWISGLEVGAKSPTPWPSGTIDVRSEGFCTGDAPASGTQVGAGVAATPYVSRFQTWGTAPSAPCADTLDIKATNVKHVVVDAVRARVDCNVKISLTSDGPIEVDVVNAGEPCGSVVKAASVGGANVTTLGSTMASLPNTGGSAGAAGAAGVLASLALLATRVRRRGSRRR